VTRQFAIRRLLAILVVAGLVLAPLSRPVMAGTVSDASMQAMADDMSMSAAGEEMAAAMPCCPTKAPAPVDCDKCIYMAACMSQSLASPTATTFRPPLAAAGKIAPLQNDAWPEGLRHPPPEDPPRILA
jgi:hypothetical protein